jgi:hypothetical protein
VRPLFPSPNRLARTKRSGLDALSWSHGSKWVPRGVSGCSPAPACVCVAWRSTGGGAWACACRLSGPDGLQSGSRTVGSSYQVSFDSLMFRILLDAGASWYSRWTVNTNGLIPAGSAAVDTAATNAARLMHRMTGDVRLAVTAQGTLPPSEPQVTEGAHEQAGRRS